MKKLRVLLMSGLVCMLPVGSAMAWVLAPGQESPSQAAPEYWNAETRELVNTVQLNQRISERELDTERGRITIPYEAQIIDKRPVEEWYDVRPAKVTFYGRDNKIVRVEINY